MNPPTSRLARYGAGLLQGLKQLVYPNACRFCEEPLPADGGAFCPACRGALAPRGQRVCPRCAADVGPYVDLTAGCVHCRDEAFAFDRALRLGGYDGLLREAVLRLKHQAGEALAEALGRFWALTCEADLRAAGADVVVPVPLHWWARWRRGYNQSEALAQALASTLKLPCRPAWLRRTRATAKQHHLDSPSAKKENVHGAFHAGRGLKVQGKTVLLIDDVMTTGGTASAAARPLREAGAAAIVVAVLARGGM
jgi:ComF family protein